MYNHHTTQTSATCVDIEAKQIFMKGDMERRFELKNSIFRCSLLSYHPQSKHKGVYMKHKKGNQRLPYI